MKSENSSTGPTEVEVKRSALETLGDLTRQIGQQIQSSEMTSNTKALFADLAVQIGDLARIQVEVRKSLDRYALLNIKDQLDRYADVNKAIFTDYVSPKLAEELQALKINFVDSVGNISLAIPETNVLLGIRKVNENPYTKPGRPLKSLSGEPSALVVRALLDLNAPISASTLINESGASRASTYRTLDYLETNRFITRSTPGQIESIAKRELIYELAPLIAFNKLGPTYGFIAPRGIASVLEKLKSCKANYALTGLAASTFIKPTSDAVQLLIYSTDPDELASELGLRAVETGADVFINIPEWTVVFQRTQNLRSVNCVSTAQLAIDLAEGPGRSPQSAEALIEILEPGENE